MIEELTPWIPVFVILAIGITGAIFWKRQSVKLQIEELKEGKKAQKKKETFGGAIEDMINTAPNNLKQIESEIATLKANAVKQGLTPEQTKEMLKRLESERDMLNLAVKYGNLAKPLAGSLGKLLEKVMGGIGQ
jgi:hypothetical protein